MAIYFQCGCGAGLSAADDKAGERHHCPKCRQYVEVPGKSTALPPPLTHATAPVATIASHGPHGGGSGPASFCCPSCGSEQTQRVSVIVTAGTSQTRSRTSGGALVLSGDSLWDIVPVLGGASTKSTQQSQLAQRLAGLAPGSPPSPPAPPRDESDAAMVILVGLTGLVSCVPFLIAANARSTNEEVRRASHRVWYAGNPGSVSVFFLPLVDSAAQAGAADAHAAAVKAHEAIIEVHSARVDKWNDSFFCHRCGKVFTPGKRTT